MATRTPPALPPLRQTLQAAWSRLAARERLLVGGAAAVVGLALLWWLGLNPALRTLRQAPDQHSQLDAQLAQMRALAASADSLRSQNNVPALAPDSARRALEQAMPSLGDTAQLALQGDRATVTLRGTPPEALAQWLAQVRINARVVPVQADLQRGGSGAGWTGQLVLAGPGLGGGQLMRTTRSTRLAWLGALLGLLVALLLFAPARWLAQALTSASEGRVQLVNARGTTWNGQADLLLTGGEGSRSRTALPQGLSWQLRPGWAEGGPVARLWLSAPCCTPEPLNLTALPGRQGARLRLAAMQSQWPAELLTGLGTPWNTLRLEGRLQVQSPGLDLLLTTTGRQLGGALTIEAHDLASRLSTLRPLGSYRLALASSSGGDGASMALQTLSGELRLQGEGQWTGGRLRFRGEAEAAPGREAALANLLNIIGRRQGTRSLLNIG